MKQVSAILFDIGNVFVQWDPRFLYRKLIHDPAELEYFLTHVVTLEWHTNHDKGLPFAEGVRNLSSKFPEYEDLIAAFDSRWEETIGPLYTGTVEILETMAAEGMPVYALTNFSAEKWPAFCRDYAFTDLFDGVVVSGEEGLVKPDPEIFMRAVSRFGLIPSETVFIDDREDNFAVAQELGFQGHLFTDPETLRLDLRARPFKFLI